MEQAAQSNELSNLNFKDSKYATGREKLLLQMIG